jgi:hypothetical protein
VGQKIIVATIKEFLCTPNPTYVNAKGIGCMMPIRYYLAFQN